MSYSSIRKSIYHQETLQVSLSGSLRQSPVAGALWINCPL
jgi:hypothetical protein